MKKLIILLSLFFGINAQSQVYTPINNYGQTHQRIKVGYNLKLPVTATQTRYTNDSSSGDIQMFIKGDTNYVMYHNGVKWKCLVDSFSTSNDSLFYYKFGVKTFYARVGLHNDTAFAKLNYSNIFTGVNEFFDQTFLANQTAFRGASSGGIYFDILDSIGSYRYLTFRRPSLGSGYDTCAYEGWVKAYVAANAGIGNVTGTGTTNQLSYWSGTSTLGSLSTATYPSLTELAYVKGVTSSIQTQLNTKGVGDMVLASTQTNSGAKTFLATTLLLRNVANTFNGSFTNTNTADRIYTLPDATTTIAGLSVGTSGTPQAFTGYNTWSALSAMTNNTLAENVLTLNSTRTQTVASSTDRMLRLTNNHTIQTNGGSFIYPIELSNTVTLSSNSNTSYSFNNIGTTTITGTSNTVGLMQLSPTINDNNTSSNTTHTGIELLHNIILGTSVSGVTAIRALRVGGNITGSGGGNKDIGSSEGYTYDRTFTSALRNVTNIAFKATPTYNNGTDLTSTGYYYSAILGGTLFGTIQHRAFWNTNGDVIFNSTSGRTGIRGIATPTAWLHLGAGTASASSAPLKFTTGVASQTTKEAGAVNYDGSNLTLSDVTYAYTLSKTLTASATLDFASTAAQSSSELTITVTGAADGDVVSVGVPNASASANTSYSVRVSAANTVTVKFNNYSAAAVDPASGTFKVSVIK